MIVSFTLLEGHPGRARLDAEVGAAVLAVGEAGVHQLEARRLPRVRPGAVHRTRRAVRAAWSSRTGRGRWHRPRRSTRPADTRRTRRRRRPRRRPGSTCAAPAPRSARSCARCFPPTVTGAVVPSPCSICRRPFSSLTSPEDDRGAGLVRGGRYRAEEQRRPQGDRAQGRHGRATSAIASWCCHCASFSVEQGVRSCRFGPRGRARRGPVTGADVRWFDSLVGHARAPSTPSRRHR